MKTTRAVFKLYAVCPHCKTQNGLVSAGLYESAYISGESDHPVVKRCRKCSKEFGVLPVRGEG